MSNLVGLYRRQLGKVGQAQLDFLHFQHPPNPLQSCDHYNHHTTHHIHLIHHTQTLPQPDTQLSLHPELRRWNLEIVHTRVIAAGTVQSRSLVLLQGLDLPLPASQNLNFFWIVKVEDLKYKMCLQGWDLPLQDSENPNFFRILKCLLQIWNQTERFACKAVIFLF